jgi:hypothetical protein
MLPKPNACICTKVSGVAGFSIIRPFDFHPPVLWRAVFDLLSTES